MIALVSHDAGGAEILSSHSARHPWDFLFVLEGPARKVFERKLGSIGSMPLEEAVRQSASILCGTSWQSDLELDAIVMAVSVGKASVVYWRFIGSMPTGGRPLREAWTRSIPACARTP